VEDKRDRGIGATPRRLNKGDKAMLMIRAIVRPDKVDVVLERLMEEGFPAVTRMSVSGRGKQRGIKIGDITYDEIPKELLMMVVPDTDKDLVIKTVIDAARTGDKGAFGDGKLFVSPVEEVYTVSSGIKETAAGIEEVIL
jgi:nitrogen regulatory protein PII 1